MKEFKITECRISPVITHESLIELCQKYREPWDPDGFPTRNMVRRALEMHFPNKMVVYVGGNHVALHDHGLTDSRILLVTTNDRNWD